MQGDGENEGQVAHRDSSGGCLDHGKHPDPSRPRQGEDGQADLGRQNVPFPIPEHVDLGIGEVEEPADQVVGEGEHAHFAGRLAAGQQLMQVLLDTAPSHNLVEIGVSLAGEASLHDEAWQRRGQQNEDRGRVQQGEQAHHREQRHGLVQDAQGAVGDIVHTPTMLHSLMEQVVEARRLEERDVEGAGLAQQLPGLKNLRFLLQQPPDDAFEGSEGGAGDRDGAQHAEWDREGNPAGVVRCRVDDSVDDHLHRQPGNCGGSQGVEGQDQNQTGQ